MVYKTMRPSASVFEKFTTDNNDPIRAIKGEDEGRERKWSEFQFGSFRLRISIWPSNFSLVFLGDLFMGAYCNAPRQVPYEFLSAP
jgi:hypothetical protein